MLHACVVNEKEQNATLQLIKDYECTDYEDINLSRTGSTADPAYLRKRTPWGHGGSPPAP